MTRVQELADFVARARAGHLSGAAREQLKLRILDSLGCALGALAGEPMRLVRAYVDELGAPGRCSVIGGGTAGPEHAAFVNGALVRYLDFNDGYLAPGESCHPSDNLGAVLAAAELADGTGADLLVALAVAYQVQCRLSDEAPVRARGFDHTTQGAFAAAAGVAKALGLEAARTAHALAIAGTTSPALRVTRTGALSHWKGLAYPHTGFCAMQAALLARAGVTGPAEVLEGTRGFMEVVSGPFHVDWAREDLERVTRTDLKRYNAEIHAQSALEALLELRAAARLEADAVARVELETFQVAYDIIGGGAEGPKQAITSKEEADHSLPYLLAVALLDGEVGPAQFAPARITRADVQDLLRRVFVRTAADLTARFPARTPCRVRVILHGGRELHAERRDWAGFHGRPLPWDAVRRKLDGLAAPVATAAQRDALAQAVARLEELRVRDLTAVVRAIGRDHAGG